VEFRLLGQLEIEADGRSLPLPPAKPRALLALLLLTPNRPVSQDVLVDLLWDERPPERALKTLQVYVSQLRKLLGAERVVTRDGGYAVIADEDEVDALRFERLVRAGRAEEALALWRGEPLAEFRYERWAQEEAARLEELRLEAYEAWDDAPVAELEQLVRRYPHRERLRALLMLALYRAGRQADALAAYRDARDALVGGLGVEPGRELRELHRRMLEQDPALDAATTPAPAAAAARRGRLLLLLGAVPFVLLTAVLVYLGTRRTPTPPLEAYVVKVENFLAQSHDGRTAIADAIAAAVSCKSPPAQAAASIVGVQQNRQSLLQQLAALDVPSDRAALRSFDLLQKAAQASIAADWRYRDWLRGRARCPGGAIPAPVAAADARATRLKRAFLASFDPLARRFGKRVWRDDQF
jgi:DNA-binding SARP family transcriptional activator